MLQSFLKAVGAVNDFLNGIVWGWPVIILILGTGILLTVRTGFLQVTHFGESLNTTIIPALKSLGKKRQTDSRVRSVSQFEAFSTAISGTSVRATSSGLSLQSSQADRAPSSGCGSPRSSAW